MMRLTSTHSGWLAWSLVRVVRADIAAGRLASIDDRIDEVERIAEAAADTRSAAMAHELRGRLGVVRDGRPAVEREFPQGQRLLADSGDSDDRSGPGGIRDAGCPQSRLRNGQGGCGPTSPKPALRVVHRSPIHSPRGR